MWRNREVHDSEYSRPTNAPGVINHVVTVYDLGFRQRNPEDCREVRQIMVQWRRSDEGWICINTDGASKDQGRIAGSGGVLRDHNGQWLCRFSRFIGEANAFMAELWGVFDGLVLAKSQGYSQVEIQLDSQAVINCLYNNGEDNKICNLVRRIRNIMKEDWRVVVKHVYREANNIADGLASMTCDSREALCLLHQPPEQMISLYQHDLLGVSTPRLILV